MYSLPAMVAFGIIACSMPEVLADYPQRHLLTTSWALCFRKIYVYHIIIFVYLRSNYECKDTSFFCFSQIFFYLSQAYLLILLKFRMWFKYGLKAQKLLAQGIALGIMAISKAPCKGKSFVYCQVFESFCPYRATGLRP